MDVHYHDCTCTFILLFLCNLLVTLIVLNYKYIVWLNWSTMKSLEQSDWFLLSIPNSNSAIKTGKMDC